MYKPRNINETALPLAQNVQHIVMCETCQLSRTKRHGVNKRSDHIPSTHPNGRVFVDISTIREAGGFPLTKGVCIGVVDEYSKFGVMFFVERKGRLPIVLCEIFSKWKELGRPVKVVRCDNAGENKALEKMAMGIKWQLALTFEYTPARMPEMNYLIEKFFDTHFARLRPMLSYAHIPDPVKPLIIREAAIQCVQCSNLVLETINGRTATRYEHWCGKYPKYGRFLRVFGELNTATKSSMTEVNDASSLEIQSTIQRTHIACLTPQLEGSPLLKM